MSDDFKLPFELRKEIVKITGVPLSKKEEMFLLWIVDQFASHGSCYDSYSLNGSVSKKYQTEYLKVSRTQLYEITGISNMGKLEEFMKYFEELYLIGVHSDYDKKGTDEMDQYCLIHHNNFFVREGILARVKEYVISQNQPIRDYTTVTNTENINIGV